MKALNKTLLRSDTWQNILLALFKLDNRLAFKGKELEKVVASLFSDVGIATGHRDNLPMPNLLGSYVQMVT